MTYCILDVCGTQSSWINGSIIAISFIVIVAIGLWVTER